MKIGGWQRFSLLDYPGRLSAVIFTQGCNFRCPYCHNPELVIPERFQELQPEEDVLAWLKKRVNRLDGVVITGGEPTLQPDLAQFLKKIKKLGFLVKIDTNGSHPEALAWLLKKSLVDYWAMDIKAPQEKYSAIAQTEIDFGLIQQSIDLIMNSGQAYEFRTTVVRNQLVPEDIMEIGQMIKGAERYVLQPFVSAGKTVDPKLLSAQSYSQEEMRSWAQELEANFVKRCLVR